MTAPIDPRELRNALGRFATGVAVVTTRAADGRPMGLTVNSVAAVSLEPPLVAWSLATRSGSLPAFLAAPYFALNVLAENQEDISRRFAGTPAADRYTGVAWAPGLGGVPLLEGCLARLECRTVPPDRGRRPLAAAGRAGAARLRDRRRAARLLRQPLRPPPSAGRRLSVAPHARSQRMRIPMLAAAALLLALPAAADEPERVPPVTHEPTKKECGECHMAFQPALLPAESWRGIMAGLADHFGEDASLEADLAAEIEAYLSANAARVTGRSCASPSRAGSGTSTTSRTRCGRSPRSAPRRTARPATATRPRGRTRTIEVDCRASLDIAATVLLVTGAVGHAEEPVGQRVTPKPRDTYPEVLRQVRGASQGRCPGGLWRARSARL